MGTAEKRLYEEYQKLLKKEGIKQFNNEQIKEMLEKVRGGKKEL